ncbi:MAG: asparaginase [Actinobacteria bacterium]|nr:asparaginase [Actinomycetota bacterium]
MTDAATPFTAADLAELAVLVRSGFPESRHLGIVSAVGPDGTRALEFGDATSLFLPRSAAKPFQAIACLRAGAELADETLAIAAASHTGADPHVTAARAILDSAGLTEPFLQCPPAMPRDAETLAAALRAGAGPRRLWFNCSGKHAAMLAACVANGWDTGTYLEPSHPLQVLVREVIEEFAGPVGAVTVDGCGAPQFAVTVRGLATAFHRLATAPPESEAGRVAAAMRAFPELVAGQGHENTTLVRAVPGAVAKSGAEGVVGIGTASGHAVAVKIADGADRAATLVALEALVRIGADVSGAAVLRDVPVLGGGERVGRIEPGVAFA